jgi:hypothetical protein
MKKQLLRLMLGLFALHTAAWAGLESLRRAEPVSQLHLTASSDGLLLYGRSHFGFSVFRAFPNWEIAQGYLHGRGLKLPQLAEVYSQGAPSAVIEDARSSPSYRITWQHKGAPRVLLTPDLESARNFLDYARYGGLQSSPVGYGIPVLNN